MKVGLIAKGDNFRAWRFRAHSEAEAREIYDETLQRNIPPGRYVRTGTLNFHREERYVRIVVRLEPLG